MLTKNDLKKIMEKVNKVKEVKHICGEFHPHTKEHCTKGAYDREIIEVKELEKILKSQNGGKNGKNN